MHIFEDYMIKIKITHEITVVREHCCHGSRRISHNALRVIPIARWRLRTKDTTSIIHSKLG